MAKLRAQFICSECGYVSAKWSGQCPECGEWNTLVESAPAEISKASAAAAPSRMAVASPVTEIDIENEHRYNCGIGELDRVLGGGIVKGSVILLSGEPGIGKSTILLQICGKIAGDFNILYV